ncbi:SDR family oxidoreductase [Parahaliea maris]|uniref:SDR family oxidoreductase n=1 Tax=Parahaliea maris TaxID=2716870 RepID=A0A5C8ZU58_9GAMM|nr:SDR family oxidoreductase [Parahaliea maris]TXS92028.1 SDR family oxidoreductase [Parahaliea maris]
MTKHQQFPGKTVLVTGSAGGLGTAIVRAFAEQGAHVLAADIDLASAEALATSIGSGIDPVGLDVTSEAQWEDLFTMAGERGIDIDVVVNNAGYFQPNIPFEDMPLAEWQRHFAVNSDGVFLGCKHAIRHLRERGGAIVNIGSGMSITANPMASGYCGSKAAMLMTTRTAAASAGKYNIRVNAVLPGAVPTDMLMGNLVAGQTESQLLDTLRSHSPLNRLATPEDIARAVLFLAHSDNAAISGIFLPVDGGNMPGA